MKKFTCFALSVLLSVPMSNSDRKPGQSPAIICASISSPASVRVDMLTIAQAVFTDPVAARCSRNSRWSLGVQ